MRVHGCGEGEEMITAWGGDDGGMGRRRDGGMGRRRDGGMGRRRDGGMGRRRDGGMGRSRHKLKTVFMQ